MDILNESMTLTEVMNALTSGYFPGYKDCDSYAILNKSMNNVFAGYDDDTFFGIADDIGLHNIVFVNKEGCLESTYRDNIDKNVLDSSRIFALNIPRSYINNRLCKYIGKELSKEDLYSSVFQETLYTWDQLQFSKKVICEIDDSVIESMIESSIYQDFMIPKSNGNYVNLKTLKEYTQSHVFPGFYVESTQNRVAMDFILASGKYYTEPITEDSNTEMITVYKDLIKDYSHHLDKANEYIKKEEYDKCLHEYEMARKSIAKTRRKIENIDSSTWESIKGFVIITLINNLKGIVAGCSNLLFSFGITKVVVQSLTRLAVSISRGEPVNAKTILTSVEKAILNQLVVQIEVNISIALFGVAKFSISFIADLSKLVKAKKEGESNPNILKIDALRYMKNMERTIEDMEESVVKIRDYKKSLTAKKK